MCDIRFGFLGCVGAALLVACSGAAPSTIGTNNQGGGCTAPNPPQPAGAGATLQATVEAQQLALLDSLFGTYMRGDVVVYRGNLQAHDNASALANTAVYGPQPDGSIAEGPALARLETRVASGGDWTPPRDGVSGNSSVLVLYGLANNDRVNLLQQDGQPGTTWAGEIEPDNSTATLTGSCTACAPDLSAKPATIGIDGFTSSGVVSVFMGYAGKWGMMVDVTAHTTVTASLTAASACTLTWNELSVVNSATGPDELSGDLGLGDFKDAGDEMVWHASGSVSGPGSPCPTYTPYTIDLWVKKNDLGSFGVRNFQAGTPAMSCPPTG